MSDQVALGSRVRIPLHGRRVGGWVVADNVEAPPGVTPKDLTGASGLGPPPSVLDLAVWAAWRWAGPVASFLGTASPGRVVRLGSLPRRPTPGEATPSPGGGSVGLVEASLAGEPEASVIRLAPALDAGLLVLELVHRIGADGVLVIAPSRLRAEQVVARLGAARVPVTLLPDGWPAARSGGTVVVGTRAAAWAPMERLSAAVVLDAHDEVYREERSPTWSAVDVVVERGRRDGAPVLMVSPCPTVELTEGRRLVTTDSEVERRGWPAVELVDRRVDDPRTGLYSDRLTEAARAELARPGGRVVCILNRTGRVRVLACGSCGAVARCTGCGGAVARPEADGPLACGRCGRERPPVCATCDSARLKSLRIGVSRATEELGALFGQTATEVTASTELHGTVGPLVMGTEAALHRVDHAGLVVFLDIDQHLLAPRFGAGEETLALLARAARLVGSRTGGGRILVQTRIPDHEALRAAVAADPTMLSGPERDLRLTLGLPPFGALAGLSGAAAREYVERLRVAAGHLEISTLGEDRFLARAESHRALCDGLADAERPTGRLRIEIDTRDA